MEQKYDEVIGSASQRRATTTHVDENMLRALGFRQDLQTSIEPTEKEKPTLVKHFIESWRNEKCSPELLPFEHQLVSDMEEVIKQSKAILSQKFAMFS